MKKIFDNFYYLFPLTKIIQFGLLPLSDKKFLREIVEKEIEI